MNVLYWGEWKDLLENSNRLEILTADSVTAQEITMTGFTIEWPENEPFSDSCVFGSGATIDLLSESKLKYKDTLYTINPMQLMVKHYLNGVLNWCGWLDTEQYQDNFSNAENYNISFSANDGVKLMERLAYSDEADSGVGAALIEIKRCLQKTGLPFENIYIGLSTGMPGYTISQAETLLHKLSVNRANYFDESGEPLNCREVLNAILLPLTARLYVWQSSIYILDNETLALGSLPMKRYNYNSLAYEDSIEPLNHQIIGEMLNRREGLAMQSGVNEVKLKLSKYCYDNPMSIDIDQPTDFVETKVWDVTKNGESYKYEEKIYRNHAGFINTNDRTFFVKREEKINSKDSDAYVRFCATAAGSPVNTPVSVFQIVPGITLTSSRYVLRFSFDYMIEKQSTYEQEGLDDGALVASDLRYQFYVRIRVGDSWYRAGAWVSTPNMYDVFYIDDFALNQQVHKIATNKWIKTDQYGVTKNIIFSPDYSVYPSAGTMQINQYQGLLVFLNSDQWGLYGTDGQFFDPKQSLQGGDLSIELMQVTASDQVIHNYTYRIKNISISLQSWDDYGQLVEVDNNDKEIVGYLNSNFKNAQAIELIHGCDESSYSRASYYVNRGGLYEDSDFATNERLIVAASFARSGRVGTLEELMLNTYLSNLQKSRYLFSTAVEGYRAPFLTYGFDLLQRDGVNASMIGTSVKMNYNTAQTELTLLEFVPDILIKA